MRNDSTVTQAFRHILFITQLIFTINYFWFSQLVYLLKLIFIVRNKSKGKSTFYVSNQLVLSCIITEETKRITRKESIEQRQ